MSDADRNQRLLISILEQRQLAPVIEPVPEMPPPPRPWRPPPPPSPTQHSTASSIQESLRWLFIAILYTAIVWGAIISFGYLVAH